MLQSVVRSSDCRRPKGTNLLKIRRLDTASSLVVIVAWLRAGKGSMGWTGDRGDPLKGWRGRHHNRVHHRTSSEGPNFDLIKFRYVRGSLRPDRGNARRAEGQTHDSPQLDRSISAHSGIRLRFNRRERQDRKER